MKKNGTAVRQFEKAFARHVGAEHAIAMCNGTATLHTALMALELPAGSRVAVPPLTMASTTIAVLHAWLDPVFVDVDPGTWLMQGHWTDQHNTQAAIPVSLYGLHTHYLNDDFDNLIDDAAQTLRPHGAGPWFTSYSFQASKHLPLGEGGMLVTDDDALADRARSYSSLGYSLRDDGSVIRPGTLKRPGIARHFKLGYNYRMADVVAEKGLEALRNVEYFMERRMKVVAGYEQAIDGTAGVRPQHVPAGYAHDYWCFTLLCETAELAALIQKGMERFGGDIPFPAWRLTYHEPFYHWHYDPCPIAESIQPRLLQFQTNVGSERNPMALRRTLDWIAEKA